VRIDIESAKIELEIAQDMETVSAAEVIRWLSARPIRDGRGNLLNSLVENWIVRAAAAMGRAKRIRNMAKEADL